MSSIICSQALTINEEDDMGLTHAVYVPSFDKIYGVRGGVVNRYNAVTGSKEATQVFAYPPFDDTYIAYEPTSDKLYVFYWCDQNAQKGVYEIDPTFSVAATFHSQFDFDTAGPWPIPSVYGRGGRYCISYQDHIVWLSDGGYQESSGINELWAWRPTALADTARRNAGEYGHFLQLAVQPVDADNCVLWYVGNTPGSGLKKIYYNAYQLSTYTIGADSNWDLPLETNYGVCYDDFLGLIYSCGWHNILTKMDPGTGTYDQIDIGYLTSRKFRLQSVGIAGKEGIYVPVPDSNVVLVVDRVTDNITTKTGFNIPFDVVATPTRVFAVQLGSPSLKEIV